MSALIHPPLLLLFYPNSSATFLSLPGAFGLVWWESFWWKILPFTPRSQLTCTNSSAKDQLTGSSVAIKKIMKPFSTPVLSKRTYRELKLLKHIKHENVSSPLAHSYPSSAHLLSLLDYQPQWRFYLSIRGYVNIPLSLSLKRVDSLFNSQLFCHWAPWDRSSSSLDLKTPRKAIHPVFPVPNTGTSHSPNTHSWSL